MTAGDPPRKTALTDKAENTVQKITPFLWFDGKAEEAMRFLCFHFHELQDRARYSIWRRMAGTEGDW